MSSQYVHTASVNQTGSTHADRMSRHSAPANHHSDTLPTSGQWAASVQPAQCSSKLQATW